MPHEGGPLVDNLPRELRDLLRTFLAPNDRIALQQASFLFYHEDPGLIPPQYLMDAQRQMEALLKPQSVFAVDAITANVAYLESYPIQKSYTHIKARLIDGIGDPVRLIGMWNTKIPEAVCGLWHRPNNHKPCAGVVTGGMVDPD